MAGNTVSPTKILVQGHSFITRLDDFIRRNNDFNNSFNLDSGDFVFAYSGQPGGTIRHLYSDTAMDVFAPNMSTKQRKPYTPDPSEAAEDNTNINHEHIASINNIQFDDTYPRQELFNFKGADREQSPFRVRSQSPLHLTSRERRNESQSPSPRQSRDKSRHRYSRESTSSSESQSHRGRSRHLKKHKKHRKQKHKKREVEHSNSSSDSDLDMMYPHINELSEVLLPNSQLITNSTAQQFQLGIEPFRNNINVVPKTNKGKIFNVEQWTSACLRYAAIYSGKHNKEGPALFKYMETIRNLVSRQPGLSFYLYDQAFRSMRAKTKHRLHWDTIHTELWIKYATPQAQPFRARKLSRTYSNFYSSRFRSQSGFRPHSQPKPVGSSINPATVPLETANFHIFVDGVGVTTPLSHALSPSINPYLNLSPYPEQQLQTNQQLNPQSSHHEIVTPINLVEFTKLVTGFIHVRYLIDGFSVGFRLGYLGPRYFKSSQNLKSTFDFPMVVDAKLQKEIDLGRISGHYSLPLFPNLQISPIGVVPKKSPDDFRLINNLSFPSNSSINDFISEELSACRADRTFNMQFVIRGYLNNIQCNSRGRTDKHGDIVAVTEISTLKLIEKEEVEKPSKEDNVYTDLIFWQNKYDKITECHSKPPKGTKTFSTTVFTIFNNSHKLA
ncbi:hypothetical protein KUTeg_015949 [Tegillarca granosa]|uniref:Uncharacterized protein n=1 Tax=Tegillarca granosa TaxID=220873 RepID=A0ABQ9EJE6_TEGGR|nr:hypothetical protein KUTeg_015949 [Tegillarca granosa]